MKSLAERLQGYSPRFSPSLYKAVLGGIVASAFVIPLALVAIPYIEFFNGMAVQPSGRPQSEYGRLFGKPAVRPVERSPVAGTLPRGYEPYPFEGKDDETAALAGRTLANPLPRTMASLERGREVYETYCLVCHGKLGYGDGPVIGPERFPAPPSLHTDAVKGFADGRIFHIITRGKGKMPSYATRIQPQDRWAVVNFIHVLHRAVDPKPEDFSQ